MFTVFFSGDCNQGLCQFNLDLLVSFDNDFAILNLNLRLVDTLGEGIKLISKDMADLKKSMSPISVYYIMNLCCWMPDAIRNLLLEDYADKMTFGFSNVPGPKEPYVVCDKKNNGMGFIMPIARNIVGSFSIISHVDVMKIMISMDKETMKSTKLITDIFIENMNEMLGGTEW